MKSIIITSCNKNYINFVSRLYDSCRKNSSDTILHCDFVSTCREDEQFFIEQIKQYKNFTYNITTLNSQDIILPKHLHTGIASEMFFKLSGSIANCLKHIRINDFLTKYDYVASIDADNIINASIEKYLENQKTVADIYCKYTTVNYDFIKDFVEKKKSQQTKKIYDQVFTQEKFVGEIKLLKESFYIVRSTDLARAAFQLMYKTFYPFVASEKIGVGVPALMLTYALYKTNSLIIYNSDKLLTYDVAEKDCLCSSGYLLNKYKLKTN